VLRRRLLRVTPPTTALVAGGSLALGFAVAQVTGVRELGGAVLVAAVAVCAVQWRRQAGTGAAAALVAVYAALFVGSHLLARAVGGWPAVVLVSLVMVVASLYATCYAPLRARS
jgi:apolipoprotein N-acyltransferase